MQAPPAGRAAMDLRIHVALDDALDDALRAGVRRLVVDAFGTRFDNHDWGHSCHGWRVLGYTREELVTSAAVVPRRVRVGDELVNAGYVEGVATHPGHQGRGYGAAVMRSVNVVVQEEFDAGFLSTSQHGFYERLGWLRWRGPTYVRRSGGQESVRTADEDDGIMVLAKRPIDVHAPLTCDERPGDDW